jgi:hypothetical protein
MKHVLVLLACLAAASGDGLAEPIDKGQPPTTQDNHPKKRIAAAKTGAPAGESKPKEEPAFVPGGMPQSFIIPSNTCEQGTPLQKLLRDKPK